MKECEENKQKAYTVNVEGALNLAMACLKYEKKLIFISTNTLFDGKKGLYNEDDIPNPQSYYAVTKLVAEQAVRMLQDFIIVRTDFFPPDGLKYYTVFSDHYTCKLAVDELAKDILYLVDKKFNGIINIGGKRKDLYSILKPHYPEITPIRIRDSALPDFPRDLSLDISRWENFKSISG